MPDAKPEGETMRTTYHCEGCGEEVTAGHERDGAHHWQGSDGDWNTCGPVERTDTLAPPAEKEGE